MLILGEVDEDDIIKDFKQKFKNKLHNRIHDFYIEDSS